jgi:hypothetical protein
MPAWLHDRAEHILAKNPSMPKGKAFAIATQQSHAMGKSPKGYGTSSGRAEAKEKYKTPDDDRKTANPGNLSSSKMEKKSMDQTFFHAFSEEFQKIAQEKDSGFLDTMKNALTSPIPGTPEILGGVKSSIGQATRFGGSGAGASEGFKKFQQQRGALGKSASMTPPVGPPGGTPSMAPPAPTGAAPARIVPPTNVPLSTNVMFAPKPRTGGLAPMGAR